MYSDAPKCWVCDCIDWGRVSTVVMVLLCRSSDFGCFQAPSTFCSQGLLPLRGVFVLFHLIECKGKRGRVRTHHVVHLFVGAHNEAKYLDLTTVTSRVPAPTHTILTPSTTRTINDPATNSQESYSSPETLPLANQRTLAPGTARARGDNAMAPSPRLSCGAYECFP